MWLMEIYNLYLKSFSFHSNILAIIIIIIIIITITIIIFIMIIFIISMIICYLILRDVLSLLFQK